MLLMLTFVKNSISSLNFSLRAMASSYEGGTVKAKNEIRYRLDIEISKKSCIYLYV